MLLQCKKCSLFFRSFAKVRHHKQGTLGEQCAGEEKKNVFKAPEEEPVDDGNNPWSYNNKPKEPEVPVKQEEDNSSSETGKQEQESDSDNKSKENVVKTQVEQKSEETAKNESKLKVDDKTENGIKEEIGTEDSAADVKIKKEPLAPEVKVKEKPLDGGLPKIRKEAYADGIYKAAPVVLDSDSDEFEPESDESAPSDDDVESHLGLSRRINYKVKARKRKKVLPTNATVMYMKNSAGQVVKKYAVPQKESTRWVPPHPWVPYRTQVTVEQVCQFLEMHDYPIVANEILKKKWEDKDVFEEYARPLFEKVNPDAHPLTLKTLIKAKWFEMMNTPEDNGDDTQKSEETKPQSIFPSKSTLVKPPLPKRIKVNWTL